MKIFIYNLLIILIFSTKIHAVNVEILSHIPGKGSEVINHSKVSVHYRGYLENGIEFDNSFKRNIPFNFQIGIRKVIQGWELGLIGTKEGSKIKIKIPPELAYGKNGAGDLIAPDSTLIFEIEVLSVQDPGYKVINPGELTNMMKQEIIIVDIRSKDEWKKTGIISKSKKITAFDKKGNFESSFFKSFQKISNSTSNVVFVSTYGEISSILANGFVEQLGYDHIYSLEGGINNWVNLGNPTN